MIKKDRSNSLIALYQSLLKKQLEIVDNDKFNKVLHYVWENKNELIELINDNLENWSFQRLGFISQAILLLACGEVIILKTPKQVIINECVELAKKFGEDDETYKLINGTLDRLLDV